MSQSLAVWVITVALSSIWVIVPESRNGYQTWDSVIITWDEWVAKWHDGFAFTPESTATWTKTAKSP